MKRILGLLLLMPATMHAWAGFSETGSSPMESVIWIILVVAYTTLIPILALGGTSVFGFWSIAQPVFTLSCALSIGICSYRARFGYIHSIIFSVALYALTTVISNIVGLHFLR